MMEENNTIHLKKILTAGTKWSIEMEFLNLFYVDTARKHSAMLKEKNFSEKLEEIIRQRYVSFTRVFEGEIISGKDAQFIRDCQDNHLQ